jgi:hypothetical protein
MQMIKRKFKLYKNLQSLMIKSFYKFPIKTRIKDKLKIKKFLSLKIQI